MLDAKEKMYIDRCGKEYLSIKEACQIWVKPGYSSLSKILPRIGYQTAVNKGMIPKYILIGKSRLFKISDILLFLENRENK